MASYGTIPTASSSSGMPANVEYISRAKERLKSGLATRRPWRQMFDFHSIAFPRPLREAWPRVQANGAYFRVNYALVVLGILFLSLLWHPISLIVFIAMMALWLVLYFFRDEPLVFFGRLISDQVVLIVLSVVTIVALLLTGAITNIVSALVLGFVLVLIHAALRRTGDLYASEEAYGGMLRSAGSLFPSS